MFSLSSLERTNKITLLDLSYISLFEFHNEKCVDMYYGISLQDQVHLAFQFSSKQKEDTEAQSDLIGHF